ncbi:unnamed protein product [Fraxinus pennsylvanica]|uniref:Uncharacterized protein n=1 Tax=Fraxinus pennsylvanica TaxID=56036 RepID=A0AAD1Z894_9LAMI|nr:unnamed protein product [Fraxinus pennsylvanica]
MGNWNRRYVPRKKHRYDYEDPPPSPPRTLQTRSRHSGFKHAGVPSWEIDYCNSVRVPWYKILASKKYICCYPSVDEWDASAGEEALNDAKERYWANINGLVCDNPLPNPDLYIDEIDWNSYIDPELVSDLDRQFFNPDSVDKVDKLDTIKEEVDTVLECAKAKDDKDQSHCDNPWESNLVEGTRNLIDIKQGWNQWDDSINLKNVNPWEESHSQLGVSLKGNAWRGENESWGRNLGPNETWPPANVDYTSGNHWNSGTQIADARQGGWRQRENSSWRWNTCDRELTSSVNCGNPQEGSISKGGGYSRERSWGGNGNESWGRKQSEYQSNNTDYRDSRRLRRGGRAFNGGYRKRESSPQHTRYKSSRYEGDFCGNSRQW